MVRPVTIFFSHATTPTPQLKRANDPAHRHPNMRLPQLPRVDRAARRASRQTVPRAPLYIPASLCALVRANDTVPAPDTAFAGKKILVLAGADDKLVPWETSRRFVEALDVGQGGRKVVTVVPGVKHEFTDGMREEMFEFFWEEAPIQGAAVLKCAL